MRSMFADWKEYGFRSWWHMNVLSVGGGSSDVLFGVKIYGNRHFRTPWFRATVWRAYRLANRLHRARYWVHYRINPRMKFHLIRTGLEPGYYDYDTRIMHGCFAMLKEYVEEMGGDKQIEAFNADLRDPEKDPHAPAEAKIGQADRQSEAVAIYRWWTVEKPADEARRGEMLMQLYGKKKLETRPAGNGLHEILPTRFSEDEVALHDQFRALEQKIDDDEQAYLHRLIKIRPSLWT